MRIYPKISLSILKLRGLVRQLADLGFFSYMKVTFSQSQAEIRRSGDLRFPGKVGNPRIPREGGLNIFLSGLLIVLSLFNLGSFLWRNKGVFLTRYNPDYWQERYQRSQWAKGYQAQELMGDPELYAYAGWRQINGDDPTLINAEQSPAGKYLLGFSILIFKNQNVVTIFLGLAVLLIVFFLAKKTLGSIFLACLVIYLVSLNWLFKENLITSMLTFFICVSFLFLILAEKNKLFFAPAMISLALATATKFYLLGFGLLIGLGFFMIFMAILKKDKDFLIFFLFLPFFFLTYLGTYMAYFLKGNNFLDFKYLHFWIRHFARVQVENYPKGEIWRILLLGKWLTWWNGFRQTKVFQWTILWPISILIALIGMPRIIGNKSYPFLLILFWIFSFLSIFSLGVPYPRYLLPILPPLSIILFSPLVLFVKNGQK